MRSAALLLLALAAPVSALLPAYKAERLRELQGQGRVVVIQFTSQTCALCRQQEEILDRLGKETDKSAPIYLQADYDLEEGLRQLWRVSAPSTLVVFRGADLLDRSTGLLSEDDVRAFVRDTVARSRGRPSARVPRTVRPKR